MILNFKAREISRGVRNLTRTPTLIIKKNNNNNMIDIKLNSSQLNINLELQIRRLC